MFGFGSDSRFGPVEIDGRLLLMRQPRFSDYASWNTARRFADSHISAAFADSSDGKGWLVNNSSRTWVERCARLRRAARRGRAAPFVVVEVDADGSESVLGEFGIDAVDDWTWVGEASAWLSPIEKSSGVALWAAASMLLAGFTLPRSYSTVIGPVAVGNRSAARLSAAVGMTVIARSRVLRMYGGRPTDHDIWAMENTPESRKRLRALTESCALTPPTR